MDDEWTELDDQDLGPEEDEHENGPIGERWEDPSEEWADNVFESASPGQVTDPRDIEVELVDPTTEET